MEGRKETHLLFARLGGKRTIEYLKEKIEGEGKLT